MFFGGNNTEKSPLNQGALFSVAPIVIISLLTIFSEFSGLFYADFSLEPLIKVIGKTISPVISGAVAYSVGGAEALFSGLIGGMLTNSGLGVTSHNGNIQGFSGIYGCIIAGKVAGKSIILARKLILFKEEKSSSFSITVTLISMGTTLVSALTLNEISRFLNTFTTFTFSALCSAVPLLACILAGMAAATRSFGPVYLGGYLFATAALATGQGELMTSIFAASLASGVSMGIFCFLYQQRFTPTESACAYISLAGGVLGVSQCCAPFYIAKPVKMSLSCITGGCVSSLLCTLFRCNTSVLPKGILSINGIEKPLFFLLSIVCGVLVTVFVMSLMFDTTTEEKTEKETTIQIAENPA